MKIGTGWLGWSEQETLDTSIPTILLAYEGRVEMLKACFGGSDEPEPEKRKPNEASPEQVRSLFRAFQRG